MSGLGDVQPGDTIALTVISVSQVRRLSGRIRRIVQARDDAGNTFRFSKIVAADGVWPPL